MIFQTSLTKQYFQETNGILSPDLIFLKEKTEVCYQRGRMHEEGFLRSDPGVKETLVLQHYGQRAKKSFGMSHVQGRRKVWIERKF